MTSATRIRPSVEPYLWPVALAGALALLVELGALRVLTRTAIHIPGLERIELGYWLVSEIGRFAFAAGIVLVAALIVVVLVDAAVNGRLWLATVLSVFLVMAAAAAMGVVSETVMDSATILAVLAIPLVCFGFTSKPWSWAWLAPALFVGAFAVAGAPTLIGKVAPGFGVPVTGMWQTAEVLVIIGAIALLSRAKAPLNPRSVFVGATVGAIVLVILVAQPAAAKTLMLWNLGLAGYFHPVVYAAAIACVAYTVHRAWGKGDRSLAIGVAFIVAGGIGLHSTIQSAAFLMGVVILSDPSVVRVVKAPTHAPCVWHP